MSGPIIAFAHAALNHAETALKSAPKTCFSVAGETIALAETTPQVVQWLNGQFDPPRKASAHIYCDTTGWQNTHPCTDLDLHNHSPLAFDDILAKAGYYGSYHAATNQWELFDPARMLGLRLLSAPKAYPEWETTAPMANLLSWIMRAKGRVVLHAATLGLGGRGVLLAGPGGRGKSGTTLAGVANGLESVGDDYCVLSIGNEATARPFFRSMKQDPAGLARVGLATAATGPLNWQGKHVFDLRALFPEAAVDQLNISAILLPEITFASKTTLTPARQFEALHALAPSSMLQLAGGRTATFKACAALVRLMPSYHLRLGTNPQEIAATIKDFITRGLP